MSTGSERMSGPEAADYYSRLQSERDRAGSAQPSLPLGEVVDLLGHVVATGASLRRLIAGGATASNSREPAAPTAPRPAAAEAPTAPAGGTSPLATRVLTALMDMPDAEFLGMANKVLNRYYAAAAALAPEGVSVQVACIHCGKAQTHRVCAECFARLGPQPVEDPVHNVWAANCTIRQHESIDNEKCPVCP